MAKYKIKTKDSCLIIEARLKGAEKANAQEARNVESAFMHGILKPRIIKKNKIECVGPSCISLYDFFMEEQAQKSFFHVIMQISYMIKRVSDANLDPGRLVMDVRHVFINKFTGEVWFMYLPVDGMQSEGDIINFLRSICYCAASGNQAPPEYIGRFDRFVSGLKYFDYQKIESYICAVDGDIVDSVKRKSGQNSGFIASRQRNYYERYASRQLSSDEAMRAPYNPDIGEKTTVLEENKSEETAVLDTDAGEETSPLEEEGRPDAPAYPSILRVKTGERVSVNKPVFRIGKEKSYVDLFISDNGTVSRSHADIICRNGAYYIKDLNSKNKTYINDEAIRPHEETLLHDGDCVRLANEEFVFEL